MGNNPVDPTNPHTWDPPVGGFPVVPNDAADLPFPTRGLMVGGGGDVKVTFVDGSTVVLPALLTGIIYPMAVRRIWAAGTGATSIVALL